MYKDQWMWKGSIYCSSTWGHENLSLLPSCSSLISSHKNIILSISVEKLIKLARYSPQVIFIQLCTTSPLISGESHKGTEVCVIILSIKHPVLTDSFDIKHHLNYEQRFWHKKEPQIFDLKFDLIQKWKFGIKTLNISNNWHSLSYTSKRISTTRNGWFFPFYYSMGSVCHEFHFSWFPL